MRLGRRRLPRSPTRRSFLGGAAAIPLLGGAQTQAGHRGEVPLPARPLRQAQSRPSAARLAAAPGDECTNQPKWHRREFIRLTAAAAVGASLGAAQRNIYWGLGEVTWTAKAAGPIHWSQICPDVQAAGFDGVEPFTTANLQVNDQNMNELAELLPKHKLRVSTIYWGDNFHLPAEEERLLEECRRFLGYLTRFESQRLTSLMKQTDPKYFNLGPDIQKVLEPIYA